MFGLLRNRDFGLLWLAGLIAFTGASPGPSRYRPIASCMLAHAPRK